MLIAKRVSTVYVAPQLQFSLGWFAVLIGTNTDNIFDIDTDNPMFIGYSIARIIGYNMNVMHAATNGLAEPVWLNEPGNLEIFVGPIIVGFQVVFDCECKENVGSTGKEHEEIGATQDLF